MATVLRYRNVDIMIRSRDHAPPHVHARTHGAEAKIYLDGTVEWSKGFTKKDLKRMCAEIVSRKELLMEKWNEIHKNK
jgi:hypothetical protein